MGSSLLLKGGTNTPRSIVESFSLANAFVPGDAIRYDIPSSTWVKAQADSAENSEVAGIVSAASFNTFDLTYSGYIQVSALSGVSAPVLFLDSTIAGGLTTSPPSAIGTVIKPVLTKTTNGSGYIVTNYLGTQIGGSSTVAIDEIQPVGTIMPFAGSVIPDSWLECNGNSYAVSAYPNLYAKLQYSGGDRQPAYGSVCTLNMNSASNAITSSAAANVGNIAYINNRTSTASGATPTYLAHDFVAQIVGKADNTLYIQILPKYNSTTKSFSYPNTTINGADFTGGLYSTLSLYSSLTSTTNLSAAALINASTLTHFNTPDLRGRFAIGANTTAISELETDVANNSAISAIYSLGSEGGEEKNSLPTINATVGGGSANGLANVANNLLNNIPPYTVVRYIIKATPYTRAAIIDGIDIPYTSLLVGDLRDGSLRPGGSGEDLLFKTNNGTSGTERMRLTNAGFLGIGTTTPQHKFVVSSGGQEGIEFIPGNTSNRSIIQAYNRSGAVYTTLDLRASDYKFVSLSGEIITINSSGQTNIPNTTESASTTTGGLTLGGGLGMAKNLTVGGGISAAGGITFSGLTRVTNNTPSTATNIGALTVAGGVGIAGALYVGAIQTQTLNAASNATSNNTATGALTVVGGAGIGGALNVGGGISAAGSLNVVGGISAGGALTVGGGITAATLDCSGQVKSGSISTGTFTATSLAASATTPSTNTATGALTVAGGAGIGGALNVGGGITAARLDLGSGAIKTTGTIDSGSITSSGTFTATSLNASANTPSTNTTTGALVVVGGAGIAGALHVGGGISAAGGITFSNLTRVTNTTASTSTTTGALTVTGGAGIAGALYVGGITTAGGITMGGALTVGGAAKVNSGAVSTNTTTGALTVVGGVGIGGALYVGGGISADGITLGSARLAVPVGNSPIFGARAYGGAVFTSASAVTTLAGSKNITASSSGTNFQVNFAFDAPMPNATYVVMALPGNGGNALCTRVLNKTVNGFQIDCVQRSDGSSVFQTGFTVDVVVFA